MELFSRLLQTTLHQTNPFKMLDHLAEAWRVRVKNSSYSNSTHETKILAHPHKISNNKTSKRFTKAVFCLHRVMVSIIWLNSSSSSQQVERTSSLLSWQALVPSVCDAEWTFPACNLTDAFCQSLTRASWSAVVIHTKCRMAKWAYTIYGLSCFYVTSALKGDHFRCLEHFQKVPIFFWHHRLLL